MDGEAMRWQRRLRREFGDDRLVVEWNRDLERFRVGQRVGGLMDHVMWFYVVAGPDGEFRPLDQRTVRKVNAHDKRNKKIPKADQFRRDLASAKAERKERDTNELAYKIRHETEFHRGRWGIQ